MNNYREVRSFLKMKNNFKKLKQVVMEELKKCNHICKKGKACKRKVTGSEKCWQHQKSVILPAEEWQHQKLIAMYNDILYLLLLQQDDPRSLRNLCFINKFTFDIFVNGVHFWKLKWSQISSYCSQASTHTNYKNGTLQNNSAQHWPLNNRYYIKYKALHSLQQSAKRIINFCFSRGKCIIDPQIGRQHIKEIFSNMGNALVPVNTIGARQSKLFLVVILTVGQLTCLEVTERDLLSWLIILHYIEPQTGGYIYDITKKGKYIYGANGIRPCGPDRKNPIFQ